MVTIVAGPDQLPADAPVWGRGDRSLTPERREAVDWFTLSRFLGWDTRVAESVATAAKARPRCLILTGDPGRVSQDDAAALAALLEREPTMVVARAAPVDSPLARLAGAMADGSRRVNAGVRWVGAGPSRTWQAWVDLEVDRLATGSDHQPWALVGQAPLAVARRMGRGHVVTVACHPSRLRDSAPPGTGILRHLLAWGTTAPVAWLDVEDTLVLRMDDPGSSAGSHLSSWRHPPLSQAGWAALATQLAARRARLSVGYVPGWVDDGDAKRGTLRVAGEHVARVAGSVHPSPLVRYDDHLARAGGNHDHESEYRGIKRLLSAGAGDVEQHGYTHVRALDSWPMAADRYDAVNWYREFEGIGVDQLASVDLIQRGRRVIQRFFDTRPVALLCPGQTCSEAVAASAVASGFVIVATEALGIRNRDRLCWSRHVLSPYLDGPHGCWFEAGLPVIGCFHDRDLVMNGQGWLPDLLDRWTAAGARRLIDFRALAGMLTRRVVIGAGNRPSLERAIPAAPPLVGPVPVRMRTARGALALWHIEDPVSTSSPQPIRRRPPPVRPRRRAEAG